MTNPVPQPSRWSPTLAGRRSVLVGRLALTALEDQNRPVWVDRVRPPALVAQDELPPTTLPVPPVLGAGWSTRWASHRVALRSRLGRTPHGWSPTLFRPGSTASGGLGWRPRGRGSRFADGWADPPVPPAPAKPPRTVRTSRLHGGVHRQRRRRPTRNAQRPPTHHRQRVRLVRYARWRRLSQSYRTARSGRGWRRLHRAARLAALLRRRLTPRLRRYQAGVETFPEVAQRRWRRAIVRAGRRHARAARQYTLVLRPTRRAPRWGCRRRLVGVPRVRPIGRFRRRRRWGARPRPLPQFVGLHRRPRRGWAPTPQGWSSRGAPHWASTRFTRRQRTRPLPKRPRPYTVVPPTRLRVDYGVGPPGRFGRRRRWGRPLRPKKSLTVWVDLQGRTHPYTRGYTPPRYTRTPGRTRRWSNRRVRRWRPRTNPVGGLYRRHRWGYRRRGQPRRVIQLRAYFDAVGRPSPADHSSRLVRHRIRSVYTRVFRHRGRRWRLNRRGRMFPTWRPRLEGPRVRRPARLVRGAARPVRRFRRRLRRRRRQLRWRRPYRRRRRAARGVRPLRRRRFRRWSRRQRRRNRRLHPGRRARAARRGAARRRRREMERLLLRRVSKRLFRWRSHRVATRCRRRRARSFQALPPVSEASVLQTQVVRLMGGFQRHGVATPVDRVGRLVRRRFHRGGRRVGHLFYRLFTTVDIRVVRRGGVATQLPCVGRPARVVRLVRRWLRLGVARAGWTPEWTDRVYTGLTNLAVAEAARHQHNTVAMTNLAYL